MAAVETRLSDRGCGLAGSSSSESELELVEESEVLLVEEDVLLDEFVEDFRLRSGTSLAGCFG